LKRAESSQSNPNRFRIAIVDSGLDIKHPHFAGLSIDAKDFTQSTCGIYDIWGHGTHHLGVIVSLAKSDTNLLSFIVAKVVDDYGFAPWKLVDAAIRWSLLQKVDVISIGVGAPEATKEFYATVRLATRKTLIVAPVGNDFQNGMGKCLYPARYAEVLGVAGCTAEEKMRDLKGLKDGCDIYIPIKGIDGPLPGNRCECRDGSSTACAYTVGLIVKLITRFRSLVSEIQSANGKDVILMNFRQYYREEVILMNNF